MGIIKNIIYSIEELFLSLKKKKDVLYVVHNELMLFYINQIKNELDKDNRIRGWVCFTQPDLFSDSQLTKLKQCKTIRAISYKLARQLKWDAVIIPDHTDYFRDCCQKIYINHGVFTGIQKKGEYYEFGSNSRNESGQFIYDKLFLSNEIVVQKMEALFPEIKGKVVNVGSVMADKIKQYPDNRLHDFNKMGLSHNKKTLIITSSWGKNSIIQKHGTELITKAKELSQQFNIIFSLHVNCYNLRHSEGKNWTQELKNLEGENIYILPCGDNIFPLLQYSDFFICDLSSMTLYYAAFSKPILLFDNPNIELGDVSPIKDLRENTDVFSFVNELNTQKIIDNMQSYNVDSLKVLSDSIFGYPGQSVARQVEEVYKTLSI